MATTVEASPQTFYVDQLSITIDASRALLDISAQTVILDASAHAEVSVPVTLLSSLFQFWTDASDVNDATNEDLLFRVYYPGEASFNDTTFYNNLPLPLKLLKHIVQHVAINGDREIVTGTNATGVSVLENEGTPGPIHFFGSPYTNLVAQDYVRYLATKVFNTYRGVDLFANEEDVRTQLQIQFDASFENNLYNLYSASPAGATKDADPINAAQSILGQIVKNDPDRLSDISGNRIESMGGGHWFRMPLVENDLICFLLTVNADANQMSVVNLGGLSIETRTYLIKLKAVNDSAGWVQNIINPQ